MRTKPGFTLTELLVTIAIMGMMFGLLVPVVERSLGGNRIANDAEIFRAKLEEVRLKAGSTQSGDETSTSFHGGNKAFDEVGYYAIWLHQDDYRGGGDFYNIVRLSYPVNADASYPLSQMCHPNKAQDHAWNQAGECFVERVKLSPGVHLSCRICTDDDNKFLAFSVPSGQFFEVETNPAGNAWEETIYQSDNGENPDGPLLELTYNGKKATITIDRFTAKTAVRYN